MKEFAEILIEELRKESMDQIGKSNEQMVGGKTTAALMFVQNSFVLSSLATSLEAAIKRLP